MSYNPLSNDSGQTPERRREEAEQILGLLDGHIEEMTPKEQEFIESVSGQTWCSVKQLFWLRDLKEKYL